MLVRSAIRLIDDWFSIMDAARPPRFPMRTRDPPERYRLKPMDPVTIRRENAAKVREGYLLTKGRDPTSSPPLHTHILRCPNDSLDGHGAEKREHHDGQNKLCVREASARPAKKKKKEEKQKRKTENSGTQSEASDVERPEGDRPEPDAGQSFGLNRGGVGQATPARSDLACRHDLCRLMTRGPRAS